MISKGSLRRQARWSGARRQAWNQDEKYIFFIACFLSLSSFCLIFSMIFARIQSEILLAPSAVSFPSL
jgi:hypothetical protein